MEWKELDFNIVLPTVYGGRVVQSLTRPTYQSEGTGSNLGHCRNLSVACAPRAYPVNSAVNGCTGYFTWSQVGKVVMEKGGNRPYSASHEKSKAAILRFFHGFQLVQWPSGAFRCITVTLLSVQLQTSSMLCILLCCNLKLIIIFVSKWLFKISCVLLRRSQIKKPTIKLI